MTSPLERLPTELRYAIFSPVIWTQTPPPEFSQTSPDRVCIGENWDIWVESTPRPPAALSLLLTSRTLHHDVQHLVSSDAPTNFYELDIAFIPECGLFPTWIVCPLPSQRHIPTLRVSIRILSADDIDYTPLPSRRPGPFAARFPGQPRSFELFYHIKSQPPRGACNFYHLLGRFLALGPLGVVSNNLAYPTSPTRQPYTLTSLHIATTSKPHSSVDDAKFSLLADRQEVHSFPNVPFGGSGDTRVFGAPPADAEYVWSGPTTPSTVYCATIPHSGERLGLYLALAFWGLLDLSDAFARGFGRRVFEGVLGTVEFWVDGVRRERPVYDTERLLARLSPPSPPRTGVVPENGGGSSCSDRTPPEMGEELEAWRLWLVVLPPPPGRAWPPDISRHLEAMRLRNVRMPLQLPMTREDVPAETVEALVEALEAWRCWVGEWRRKRRVEVARGEIWQT